jgi:hypothetical protein
VHSLLMKELHSVVQWYDAFCCFVIFLHVSFYILKGFVSMRFVIVIMQFQFVIGMNCWAWTCCMNVRHKWPSSFLSQFTVSVLWLLIIFWCRNVKCNEPYIKEVVYDWLFVCVIHGDCIKSWPQCILQYRVGLEGVLKVDLNVSFSIV